MGASRVSLLGRKISSDARGIRCALGLARHGAATVFPNPAVGAIVVSGGSIVGYGWHRRAGGDHAEVEALRMAGEHALGGTLYVTLEPCNHHGNTPPCTEAVLRAGIAQVVIGIRDPNPLVTGGGSEHLQRCGVVVRWSELAAEVADLDLDWLTRIGEKLRPAVSWWAPLRLDGSFASIADCRAVFECCAMRSRWRRFVALGGSVAVAAEERAAVERAIPGAAQSVIEWSGSLEPRLRELGVAGVRHLAFFGGAWVAQLSPTVAQVDKIVALHLPSVASGNDPGSLDGLVAAWRNEAQLTLQRVYRAGSCGVSVYRVTDRS